MATKAIPTPLQGHILDLSRQLQIGPLSPYFLALLDRAVADGYFPSEERLVEINDAIIQKTREYREQTGVSTVVIGMSGGVDSALTAAIFKAAGYRVVGVTMPINQVEAETDRGVEACNALGIEHQHIDLTTLYDHTLNAMSGAFSGEEGLDPSLADILTDDDADAHAVRIRRGNIRARLRMITLYNLASALGGMVASTDNLSELSAGFWTLHGDVGDFSPIQSLLKSWEVPYLARLNGVPESTVRAKPTDGLGISPGDEAQLGCSYLEWDLMVYAIATGHVQEQRGEPYIAVDPAGDLKVTGPVQVGETEPRITEVYRAVVSRMGATWYKRMNPLNLPHPSEDRYYMVESIDRRMFVPKCFQ